MKISTSPLTKHALRALLMANAITVAAFAQAATQSNSADRNVNDRPLDNRTTNGSQATSNEATQDRLNADGTRASSDRLASDTGMATDNAMTKPGWGDKRFLNKAAKSGMEEVAISQVAATKATNPEVRAFAQMMVRDHQKVNGQLTSTAGNLGVSLSDSMGKHDDDLSSKWQKKDSGAEFDKDYIDQMVSDHEDAIELFGKGAKSDNAQIASLASGALPQLQQHYTRAQQLQRQLKQQ